MPREVKHTTELQRILDLPRRSGIERELVLELTSLLKTPEGTMILRDAQALALYDIGTQRGGFLPLGVGEGKTAVSFLAADVLDACKPILLLPAGLIENAERARIELSKHWRIPKHVRIISYEMLGREQASKELDEHAPDVIICDEAHRAKNLSGAACARRIARYMAKNPATAFVAMSGTIIRDSIEDFAHMLFWALKGGAPLPMAPGELEQWVAALDEPKVSRFGEHPERVGPGALLKLCNEEELQLDPTVAARRGFRRRLTETTGVVSTVGNGENVNASIKITGQVYELKDASTEERFDNLRHDMLTPDGFELVNGVDVWRHARELALGFHSIWEPRPPEEWLGPRKRWGAFVRAYLSRSRTLDSPDQVKQAVLEGRLEDDGLLAAWQAVERSKEHPERYAPNVVEIWHDDTVVKLAAKWAQKPGIVWTDQVFFAERLSKATGLPYFGAGGLDATGRYIEDADCSKAIIASIDANRDGKNLQGDPDRKPVPWKGFSRNLLVGPPDGWDALQQTIARTHRPKQLADEVVVDVLLGCREHIGAWHKAVAGTHAASDMLGGTYKLFLADVSGIPTEAEARRFVGSRW